MSDKPLAYVSCPHTNKDAVILTNINGVLIPDGNPDEYLVVGYHHPDGADAATEWRNCNQELCDNLDSTLIGSLVSEAIDDLDTEESDPPVPATTPEPSPATTTPAPFPDVTGMVYSGSDESPEKAEDNEESEED